LTQRTPRTADEVSARISELYADAQQCAAAAGLVYITGTEPGIRRRRQGSGFGYRDARNRPVSDRAVKERIISLAIPPAWRNVWICSAESGHIMAVGEDDRGRKQYIYHERWRELRDLLNFYRLITFAEQLPTIRAHVETQLRRRTLDRDQVLAAMIRLIDTTAIRIGNEVYAEENDSFGLSTLTKRHVQVSGKTITMSFPAKSGKRADLRVQDQRVARVVTKLAARRHRRLFTVDGHAIESSDVNELLNHLTGEHITAKDFRTWHGTLAAFTFLQQAPDGDPEQAVLDAADAAAELLGNTRTVVRAHYIHPHVLAAYTAGTFGADLHASARRRQQSLAGPERDLLAFLKVALESDLDATSIGAD
jgi:DNA topoisomerase-1